jgi:tetratricopeptide (TPR) repeat protein
MPGILAWGLAAQTCLADPTADTALKAAFVKVTAAYHAKHCDQALALLAKPALAQALDSAPDEIKAALDSIGAECALRNDQTALALKYALGGTALPNASAFLWDVRLYGLHDKSDLAGEVATVETMAKAAPDALNALDMRRFHYLLRDIKDKDETALRRRLLKVLANPEYAPEAPGQSADAFVSSYATMLAEDGDKAGAAALVARIGVPGLLIKASLDPRLRGLMPADFDARAAVERDIARLRTSAAAHPDYLQPAIELAGDYLLLDEGEKALVVLRDVRPDRADAPKYADQDRQANWWWNAMAEAYKVSNRYDEALAAYRGGVTLGENGSLNVSQTINLAETQVGFGHYADALQTLEPLMAAKTSTASLYGRIQMLTNHGCASFMSGKKEAASTDLAFVRANHAVSPRSLVTLLLCMGDADGAAASQIKRLDNAEERPPALQELSDYAPTPPFVHKTYWQVGIEAMKSRPDIQAAIVRAGGIRRFNIPFQD